MEEFGEVIARILRPAGNMAFCVSSGFSERLPETLRSWLLENKFRRNIVSGNPALYVVDHTAFAGWVRNSILALFFDGHSYSSFTRSYWECSIAHLGLGIALVVGIAVFLSSWGLWLRFVVYRFSPRVFGIILGIGAVLVILLIGAPFIQLCSPPDLATTTPNGQAITVLSLTQENVRMLISAGIPRWWALLGFLLNSLVMLPILWTLNFTGPDCFSFQQAAQRSKGSCK